MKTRTVTGIVGSVIVAMAATALIYRMRSDGDAPRVAVQAAPRNFANISWVKPKSAGTLAMKPSAMKQSAMHRRAPSAGTDWHLLFSSSRDYFAFVKRAAGPAAHGDGTAALYVSRAVQLCELQVALYGHASDPLATFQNSLSEQSHMPEFAADEAQHEFELCKGFFGGDAFASLPPRAGGYLSYTYWYNVAYKDDNPVAEVLHVVGELPAIGNGSDSQTVLKARTTLISAVSSGDPEAVFRVGELLLDGHGANMTDAYAIAMAACDLGYNCSSSNPLIFGQCAAAGTCPSGEEFSDRVTKEIGSSGYAGAYAKAQQLEAAISQGDIGGIAKFVELGK
ncbi:MAG: hypothetical protein ACREV7_02590 [Steroidobacteraceae bacterium]